MINVFIIVWRKIDLFNFKSGNVYVWLIFLSRNKAIEFIRNNGKSVEANDKNEDFYIIPLLEDSIDSLSLQSAMNAEPEIAEALDNLTEAQNMLYFYRSTKA